MAGELYDRHTRLQQRIGITEEELRRSEEKLRETLEVAARSERLASLGRLSSGVAHEIRTPLASLKLFLQSFREEMELAPEQAEDFDVAMRQVRRIESTINHFLNFARPQEPVLAAVDFPRLVEDALLVVRPKANHQEVELVHAIAPDLPEVEGDSRLLGEVLVNLLVNALEVMPHGGRIAIDVSPDGEADGESRACRGVRMDVSDTGPGIRESDLERLFEPFFTTKATGSGLGLAIVRGTVERHGGSVKVRTKPGAGTTFCIRLPSRSLP
jgi:signal transduction histidine kinase